MSASYREAAARRAAQQPAKKTCASILRRIFSLPHQTAERREQAVNFEEMQAAATAALEKTASEAQATAQLAKEKATEMLRSSEAFIAEMDKSNSCAKWTGLVVFIIAVVLAATAGVGRESHESVGEFFDGVLAGNLDGTVLAAPFEEGEGTAPTTQSLVIYGVLPAFLLANGIALGYLFAMTKFYGTLVKWAPYASPTIILLLGLSIFVVRCLGPCPDLVVGHAIYVGESWRSVRARLYWPRTWRRQYRWK